jgi:predicted nucleic acid-binding Zn ribbon protein
MKFPDIPPVSAFKRKVRTIPDYTNSHSGVIFIGNGYSHRDSRSNGQTGFRHKKQDNEVPY